MLANARAGIGPWKGGPEGCPPFQFGDSCPI